MGRDPAATPVYLVDYVVDPLRPGGSGLSDIVWDMAVELGRRWGEPHVVAPYRQPPTRAGAERVHLHTFAMPPIGYRNVIGHVLIALAAYREIRRQGRWGIVHAPEYISTGVIAPLARGTPVVLTVPGNIDEKIATGNNPYDWSMTLALRVAARLSARYCARVVATSSEMTRWWSRTGVAPDRLMQVPLGVDTARFAPRAGARSRLGWPAGGVALLSVGRLNEENGIADLVQALPAVAAALPEVELHVVGTGPEEAALRRSAEHLGVADRVRWHGWIDTGELADYYSACDLFVFTARAAGLPRVVIEAMACGAAVLATAISGVADHVEEGRTGYLTPPRDAGRLAARIVEALRDPHRPAVGEAARAHVEARLSWGAVVDRLIEHVYQPLAARRG